MNKIDSTLFEPHENAYKSVKIMGTRWGGGGRARGIFPKSEAPTPNHCPWAKTIKQKRIIRTICFIVNIIYGLELVSS